jgi:hypothetical protein
MLSVVLMMTWCCDASFGDSGHTKVIVHVPVKYHTHTHTIYRHIYHHHKAKEVEKPVIEEMKVDEEKKVEEAKKVEETHHGPIAGHDEQEKKPSHVEVKYDRPDFHAVAKKLVESMMGGNGQPWAMHFHVIKRTH